MEKTLCFTGRRPKDLFGYDKSKYIPLVNALTQELEYFYKIGYRKFISGGAQGFDQLAFWAVNRLKQKYKDIKNILYIPFPKQECKWLENGLFSQSEYRLMISMADEVIYCTPNLNILIASKLDINIAMHKRNHDMVDSSSLVFGLYPTDLWQNKYTKGGTAECLRYAKDKNKVIYQMNPFNLECFYSNNETS